MKRIQILGTGCPKCEALAASAAEAIRGLDGEYEIVKVTEVAEILAYGVMVTPALAVEGEVKAAGKLLSAEEIMRFLA